MEAPRVTIDYTAAPRRRPWRAYLLGVITLLALYLFVYLGLRGTGVFHAYYSQGSWEIEGGTGVYAIDLPFMPLAFIEGNLHNHLRWLREPVVG